MKKYSCLLIGVLLAFSFSTVRAELVLAAEDTAEYQIVISNRGSEEIVDRWLLATARLIELAFKTNGFQTAVVFESDRDGDKPAIYLGATGFAESQGIVTEKMAPWVYQIKAVGQNLIIAGHDRQDPLLTIRHTQTPLAQLGTVKGACDFLREYAGVRFLFLNMQQSHYATRGGGLDDLSKGHLDVDTRSLAFLPVKRIAIPAGFDLVKKPAMLANCDSAYQTFHYIALNFFPRLGHLLPDGIQWYQVIPPDVYSKTNPEFFALQPDGRRACDIKIPHPYQMQYCVTHPGVQELMRQAVEEQIAAGHKIITIRAMDAFRLCRCNCERCNEFFGRSAMTGEEYYARGHSGKLWQAYFMITDRYLKSHPDVMFVLPNYQDTPANAKVISEFPENVILRYQFAAQHDFDRLEGVNIPGGLCGFEETFTGFGQAGGYLPERTPEHIASVVETMVRNKVKWSMRDGAIGYVRGLQAPAYYVYGRQLDDPRGDWKAVYEEFCTAAFGETATIMKRFYDLLHEQISVYSDYFGVFMPGWNRKYSRTKHRTSKWHVLSMYPPEYCTEAEYLLTSAERKAADPDVKARLQLIRVEFNYVRGLANIFHLHNAWLINNSDAYLFPLLDAIESWHGELKRLSGDERNRGFKPLPDWPQMRPFNGHHYSHAALLGDAYQQQWRNTCINWDTEAIRNGILKPERSLTVAGTDHVPGIDDAAWEAAPEQVLRKRNDMPFNNVKSTFKVLRDSDCLYVRMECLFPYRHPEDLFSTGRDGAVFRGDNVELAIQPAGSDGRVFRLAALPAEDSRYDSVFEQTAGKKMKEDNSWNGDWKFDYKTNIEKGRWNQSVRVYISLFSIPFADLGVEAPGKNEVWGFNAARNRLSEKMLWRNSSETYDPQALGEIIFN